MCIDFFLYIIYKFIKVSKSATHIVWLHNVWYLVMFNTMSKREHTRHYFFCVHKFFFYHKLINIIQKHHTVIMQISIFVLRQYLNPFLNRIIVHYRRCVRVLPLLNTRKKKGTEKQPAETKKKNLTRVFNNIIIF